MKYHYIIYVVAVISIVCLQGIFINSQYDNYISTEQAHIETMFNRAIDLELHVRKTNDIQPKYKTTYIPYREISKEILDSLLAIKPLPRNSPKIEYDIVELIDKGVISSIGDISKQYTQDNHYEVNRQIDVVLLDSLYDLNSGRGYDNRFVVYDSTQKIKLSFGDESIKYNYTSPIKQIGLKGYQFLELKTHIPVSEFIMQSIWILVMSFIIVIVPILFLFYQLTSLRNKTKQLAANKINICGTIHDIKSPLNCVYTMLSWLQGSEKDPNKKELLKSYKDNLLHSIQNIETLLTLIKDHKTKSISKNPVTVSKLIEIINFVTKELGINYLHKKDRVQVVCGIPDDLVLYINELNFENIIRNLLENALKYSDDNVSIELFINLINKKTLSVTVKDNGWGIDKKHQRQIFKQFYQIPIDGIKQKGHGVGLAYVRHIVREHGGKITIKSIENKGSEFHFTINITK